ncbi:hypothetical protein C5Y96_02880 [Blastopirellula marina]|uniref:Tetratricopeptide repeat protein n=1 Tax=Blastopirellula marina TaxID=124 RepID=A0A2S8G3F7_9BACT|nr:MULTISPECIES: hypothetical protein [Pirellulaceae]PQO38830.1 hypothetical protein C5Y96_02880 [Blastopirellula marina]RCS55138.1 hypothetical protein DTL36_02885 [Bremerella cremea]
MTGDISDQIYDLQVEAYNLPNGETQLHLYEAALRLAERSRDLDLIFPARLYVACGAGNSGYEEKTMAELAWCLAVFEKDRERFLDHKKFLLSILKTFLCGVSQYPHVTRDKFDQLLGQLDSHLRHFGYSQRTIHYVRMSFARSIGDRETTIASHDKYLEYPRDEMSHKVPAEAESEFWYYWFLEETEKEVETAIKILTTKPSKSFTPHDTYSGVLRSLALLKQYEEADQYQQKGYRLIRDNRKFLELVGFQIAYLLHRERTAPAIRMFERHLLWGLETHDQGSRYIFYVAAQHLFTAIAQEKPVHKLNLPPSFPVYQDSSEYDVQQIIDWLEKETSSLAAAFDQRNGNAYFSVDLPRLLKY